MIKYIGSKRVLVPRIVDIVDRIPGVTRVCDVFTGTTRVAQGLKRAGYRMMANDAASYSRVLGECYVEADLTAVDERRLVEKIRHLDALPGVDGYFTETFCVRSRFFQPHNGRRIDAIRGAIDDVADGRLERSILLTSLMEAADRVDSTTGLQMAYLKRWSPRSHARMELRLPVLIPGGGAALQVDANVLARRLGDMDLVYVDPPYNQHSYFANYHIWETLIRADAPEHYGVACKRVDCRDTKSDYNSRRRAWDAFADLIGALDVPYILVSFSDEGFFAHERIVELLDAKGETAWLPVDSRRYVGAQIGIHDHRGKRVGQVGHLRNREYLFLVGEGAGSIMAGAGAQLPAAGAVPVSGGRGI